jgi:hypothetical protein
MLLFCWNSSEPLGTLSLPLRNSSDLAGTPRNSQTFIFPELPGTLRNPSELGAFAPLEKPCEKS